MGAPQLRCESSARLARVHCGTHEPPNPPATTPRPAPAVSRRHDQSYKLLFSIPLAVEQLIRHFLDTDLADELDFERVEILATERIAAGLVRSHADLLWKIHFRENSRHLLLAIEFQSAADRYMSVRIHYYVAATYHAMTATGPRRGELAPGGAAAAHPRGDDLQRAVPLDGPWGHLRTDRAGARVARRTPAEAAP